MAMCLKAANQFSALFKAKNILFVSNMEGLQVNHQEHIQVRFEFE